MLQDMFYPLLHHSSAPVLQCSSAPKILGIQTSVNRLTFFWIINLFYYYNMAFNSTEYLDSEKSKRVEKLKRTAGSFNGFTLELRPLQNSFSLIYMNFLTHLRACSLNPENSA